MQEIIEKRTRNSKTHDLGNNQFAWDGSIGSIHYSENGEWLEIDNIFEPAVTPWNWQILKAGYHIRVKEDFTAGQIIEFEKQGETVQFQPMALEWTNDLDMIQQISMPQNVVPTVTNPEVNLLPAVGMPSHQGTIKWNNAYGEGIDFEWQCTSARLVKILEIESLNKLPVPEQYILDGGNPVLRLNLIFDPSSGVDIYVDNELWDKSSKKQTFNIIEFRKGDEVLWGFMPLRYWGSGGGEDNEGQSVATLEKSGNKLYISIRVPYEWLQNAIYPVFIDIDVDEEVWGSENDADEDPEGGPVLYDWAFMRIKSHISGTSRIHSGARFTTVAVPQGATISGTYQELKTYDTGHDDINCKIYAHDTDDSDDFADNAYISNETFRPRTTAFASWVANGLGIGWMGSGIDISSVIQEVINRPGWTGDNDLSLLYIANSDVSKSFSGRTWDQGNAPKLHIEYVPYIAPVGRKSAGMAAKMIAGKLI